MLLYLPSTCPTIILPSSPATAALAFLSLAYWTKAKPLCTEQPTIFPYLLKMASTSALVTNMVLRFPMKTREFRERGSVLLVTLLAIRLLVVGEWLGKKRGIEGMQKIDRDRKDKWEISRSVNALLASVAMVSIQSCQVNLKLIIALIVCK